MLTSLLLLSSSYVPNKVPGVTPPGITKPFGFFDPLKFSSTVSESKFKFYQEAELKHGRVAMLAAVGFPLAEQVHPLWGGNINVPSYIAFQATPLQVFWVDVVLFIAIFEIFSVYTFNNPFEGYEPWTIKRSHTPGDFGFDPLGLLPKDEDGKRLMKTKELNNGRVAMGAIAIMMLQELLTGQKIF